MNYNNILNRSQILTAQVQTDVEELNKDYKAGLFNYGLKSYFFFFDRQKRIWEKISETIDAIIYEREQAGIIASER